MRSITLFCLLAFLCNALCAQYVYTIQADSVKLTGCDSSELIIENHTQNIPGFLFNTGNGRTIFRHGLQRLSSGAAVIGVDTLNAWVQGGNRFGATGIIGTLDNNPLDLYSNGSPLVRLTPSGRTLFGTTTDNGYNKFQFNGNIFDTLGYFTNISAPLTGNSNSGAIRLRWGTGDGVYIAFFNQANTTRRAFMSTPADSRPFYLQDQVGVTFGNSPYVSVGAEGNLNAKFNVYNASPGVWSDMAVARFYTGADSLVDDLIVSPLGHTILNSKSDNGNQFQVNGNSNFAGNIGIGTATPAAQLHTTGSVRFAGLTQDSTQTRVLVSDANGNLYTRSVSSLAGSDMLRSSLTVNGTIKSNKIIISPDQWADYVFDSSYRLPDLTDVDAYIRREHHLPGIPSAVDVHGNGLDVGDSQTALLKKLEELTLYTIAEKKEIEAMKLRMEKLEKLLLDKKKVKKMIKKVKK